MKISKLGTWKIYHLSDKRYTKGVPLWSKMVYKRVRGWTSGRNFPVWNFVEYPRDKNLHGFSNWVEKTFSTAKERLQWMLALRWQKESWASVRNFKQFPWKSTCPFLKKLKALHAINLPYPISSSRTTASARFSQYQVVLTCEPPSF